MAEPCAKASRREHEKTHDVTGGIGWDFILYFGKRRGSSVTESLVLVGRFPADDLKSSFLDIDG